MNEGLKITEDAALRSLISNTALDRIQKNQQLSLFDNSGAGRLTQEDVRKCLTGQL